MFYYNTISEKVQGTLTSLRKCYNKNTKIKETLNKARLTALCSVSLTHKNGGVQMQNVAVLFEQAAEQFAAAYPENGPLSPWITEQLGVTEPYLRGKAGVAAASAGTAAAYRQLDSPLSGHAPHRRPCGSSAGAGISTNLVASLAGVWYRHGLFRLGKFVAGSRRGVAAAAGNTAGTLLCRDSAEI